MNSQEMPSIERAVVQEIADRDMRAKQSSMGIRSAMQTFHQKSFGEWGAVSGDPPELADYYSPQIGRRIDKVVAAMAEMIFVDPGEFSNFTVRCKWEGLEIRPDVDITKLMQSRARVKLREIALAQRLQDALRTSGFLQVAHKAFREQIVTGNCYGSVSCDDITEEGGSGTPINMYAMPDDMIQDDVTARPNKVIHRYTPYRVDPRNLFPGSIEDDRGVNFLEWWTEYDVATWHDLDSRRAEKNDQGEWEGRYFNLDLVGENSPPDYIHRVYYDDIRNSEPSSWNFTAMPYSTWIEKGWRICRYVGLFGPGDISTVHDGGEPTSAQWNAFLKRMGNTQEVIDNRKNLRWWVAEIAYEAKAAYPSGGVLVRFEPHPLFKGKRCPMAQGRFAVYSGSFFGRGMYTGIAGDEELWNVNMRCSAYLAILASMPPAYYREDMFDADYIAENQGRPRFVPGAMAKIRPETAFTQGKPIEFFLPAENSYLAADHNMSMTTMNIDQRTGIGDLQFGQAQKDVTATVGAAAQQNAYTTVKDIAVMAELNFVMPMADMILQAIVDDVKVGGLTYRIDSYDSALAMKGMHPGVDAITMGLDEEQGRELFPSNITIPGEEMDDDMEFEVIVSTASGGRAAQIAAMEEFYARAGEINLTMGSPQFNMIDLAESIARAKGMRNPEAFRVDPEEAARQQAIAQAKMLEKAALSGGSPEASPIGVASQPAEPGGMDPALAASGSGVA